MVEAAAAAGVLGVPAPGANPFDTPFESDFLVSGVAYFADALGGAGLRSGANGGCTSG